MEYQEIIRGLARASGTVEKATATIQDAARAMGVLRTAVLEKFTAAEIQEGMDSNAPFLDYWAFWESRGYKGSNQ